MAAKLRIRKLARRLDKTPKEILDILRNLGETRYRSPADMLSNEVTIRVERALSLAGLVPKTDGGDPEAGPEKPGARAQQRAGDHAPPVSAHEESQAASPQTEAGPSPASSLRPPASEQTEAGPSPASSLRPPASEQTEAGPSPASSLQPPASEQTEAGPSPASSLRPPASSLQPPASEQAVEAEPRSIEALLELKEAEIEELRARASELEKALGEASTKLDEAMALQKIAIDRLVPAEMRSEELERELEEQRAELEEEKDLLQQKLNQAEAGMAAVKVVELPPLLARRGIQGPDEIGHLLALLLQGGWHSRTLEHLRLVEAERFLRLLKRKVVLWSGDPRQEVPEDKVALPVAPASRSELGGDREIVLQAEQFIIRCRSRNIRRITLVGGCARDSAELMRALSGRIDVRWVRPESSRSPQEADEDIEATHLTVLWADRELPYRMARHYLGKERVEIVEVCGLSGLLEELARRL